MLMNNNGSTNCELKHKIRNYTFLNNKINFDLEHI